MRWIPRFAVLALIASPACTQADEPKPPDESSPDTVAQAAAGAGGSARTDAGAAGRAGGAGGAGGGAGKGGASNTTGAGGGTAGAGASTSGAGGSTIAYDPAGSCTSSSADAVKVCNAKLGVTLKYSGVNDNDGYSASQEQLIDQMGANIVRGNGGWIKVSNYSTPFDGHTIDEVKANPNVLDWNAVGSFFKKDEPWLKWQVKAPGRMYFNAVRWWRNKQSSTTCNGGEYVLAKGTASDEAAFWTMVFAYAYWANVKNAYDLTAVEVSNEPDNCGGNGGTQTRVEDQTREIELAKDALSYVNQTLVKPPKPALVLAPGNMSYWNGKAWIDAIGKSPTTKAATDRGSFHSYYAEHWWEEIQGGAGYFGDHLGKDLKTWITEWGQWWYDGGYSNALVVHGMAPLLFKMSLWNVEASVPWSLTAGCCQLAAYSGTRMFFITRMFNRAQLSEKDMLETSYANAQADVNFAFATRDTSDLFLVYMNQGAAAQKITFDVSAFPNAEGKTVTLFSVGDAAGGEKQAAGGTVTGGKVAIDVAADTYYVAQIAGGGVP
jgi:hypothetical protein